MKRGDLVDAQTLSSEQLTHSAPSIRPARAPNDLAAGSVTVAMPNLA